MSAWQDGPELGNFRIFAANFLLLEVGLPEGEDAVADGADGFADNFDGAGLRGSGALLPIDLVKIIFAVVVEPAVGRNLRILGVIRQHDTRGDSKNF